MGAVGGLAGFGRIAVCADGGTGAGVGVEGGVQGIVELRDVVLDAFAQLEVVGLGEDFQARQVEFVEGGVQLGRDPFGGELFGQREDGCL